MSSGAAGVGLPASTSATVARPASVEPDAAADEALAGGSAVVGADELACGGDEGAAGALALADAPCGAGWGEEVPQAQTSASVGRRARREAARTGSSGHCGNKAGLEQIRGDPPNTATIDEGMAEGSREPDEAGLRVAVARLRGFIADARELVCCYECDPSVDLALPLSRQTERVLEARLVECNLAFARAVGADTVEGVLGRSLRTTHRPVLETIERLYERLRAQDFVLDDVQLTQTTREGERTALLVRLRGVVEGGRLVRIWGAFVDVTDRSRPSARPAANEGAARLRAALELSDTLVVMSATGTIEHASPSVERILGVSPAELVGRSSFDIIHPDDHAETSAKLASVLARPGGEVHHKVRLRHADGRWRWVDTVGYNLLDDVTVRGLVVTGRDVTERVEAEARIRQAQKLEAIGLLAGGVAHDFNNLLTAILGQAEFLRACVAPESDESEAVADILQAGRRTAELTRNLLTFARRDELEHRPFDVNDVVRETSRLLSRSVDRRVLVGSEVSGAPLVVSADPSRLQAMLLNLGINARDAMPTGGALVMRTRRRDLDAEECGAWSEDLAPGSFAEIEVSDTGTGIPAHVVERIFEPFFTTKPQGQGTGLGLSAVYGFVRGHGGAVRVWSEVGRGTTFRILLPISDADVEEAPASRVGISGGSGRVLVTDDEPLVADLVRRTLSRMGYEVVVVGSGREAIRAVDQAEAPFDLLLLDLNMPEMSGLEAWQAIHARDPDLPVVVMSGFGASDVLDGIREAGVRTLLSKPFRIEELARAVAAEVGRGR